MQTSEPLDLASLTKIDYSRLHLVFNPFPAVGIPEEIPATTADRAEILARFKEVLRQGLFEKRSTVTVLTGEYGAGKSHLLKYFKYRINTQLLTSKDRALGVYVKSVGRGFRDLYLYFIDDVGRDFLTGFSEELIRSYLSKADEDGSRYLFDKSFAGKQPLSKGIGSFLKNARHKDLFHDIAKSFQTLRNKNVMNSFLTLAHPDYSSIAWRWLIGERLDSSEQELLGVDGNIDDAKAAQSSFQAIVSLLLASGIKSVALMLDEFENFTLIPRITRERYMDDIRHFIDDNPTGVALIIAATPFAYKDLSDPPSALTRRLAGNAFELKFFNQAEIEELITRYLQIGRRGKPVPSAALDGHPETSGDMYPFTKDAIKRIDERTKGLVSSVVNLCRESIDKATSGLGLIDSKLVDSITF
jgi:hypothetical protein